MTTRQILAGILGSASMKAQCVARRINFCVFVGFKLLLFLLISTGWRQEALAQEAGGESTEPSPFVITDFGDYQPGAIAKIYGGGFQAGETVALQVLHADGTPSSGEDHEPWTVIAAADGTFESTWHVCEDDCRGSTLLLSASGHTTGFLAQALFTDDCDTGAAASVWAWGARFFGQLGDGKTRPLMQNTPIQPNALPGGRTAIAIAAGDYHSLVIANDGTAWAWGDGFDGELGNGFFAGRSTPGQVTPLPGGRTFVAVAGGLAHSLALANDGSAWAWGRGSSGQLGNGSFAKRSTPVQVTPLPGGRTFVAVAGGGDHSLAIASDGTAWAWGRGLRGQLGNGSKTNSATPVQVNALPGGRTFTVIAGGFEQSLAVANDGTAWAWGRGAEGQLGNGSFSDQTTPVQVNALPDGRKFMAIQGGASCSVAIADDGSAWAWGIGFLGNGTFGVYYSTPVQVNALPGGRKFAAISTRSVNTLAIADDGTAWAWGRGAEGQLGNGASADSTTPVQVLVIPFAGQTVVAVGAGRDHSLALVGEASVEDHEPPVISCPPNATVAFGSVPPAATSASAFTAHGGTISDNCDSDPSVTSTDTTQGTCPIVITRTYTVTDDSGNASTCSQTITVNNLFAADSINWHQPLARNGASEDTDPSAGRTMKYGFRRGTTIPIQIHALNCTGTDVTSNANVIGSVTVFGDSNCDDAADANAEPIEFNGVGGGGGVMDKIGGHLKYNLDTKSLPTTTQCYILRVTVTDTSTGEEKFEEVLLQAK